MRLAPRLALSLPLSAMVLAARLADAGALTAVTAAALIGAVLSPAAGLPGIAASAAGTGALAALWANGPEGPAAVLAALPTVGYLALAWHFGRTLRPGREALIARYSRLEHGALPPPLARYTRRLTLFWTVVFAGLACAAAAAPSAIAAFGLVLSVVLFLGEHAVRVALFPGLRPVGPLRTLRAIGRAELKRHAG